MNIHPTPHTDNLVRDHLRTEKARVDQTSIPEKPPVGLDNIHTNTTLNLNTNNVQTKGAIVDIAI